ncbi:hypothetical protein A9Q99_10995 [Gammaproteobacteria bacterium 45_16_T64]|nr:hypothetical protein A9Q99_10995 [Gammaproteobacteria bacterium 45_16_T64]
MNRESSATLVRRVSQLALKKPIVSVVLSLCLFLFSGYGAQFFRNTLDYHFFFSADNPQLAAFDRLQNEYSKTEAVFVAISPANNDVFSPSNLTMIEDFTRDAWTTPYSQRVDSLTNFQYTVATDDLLDTSDLFENSMTMDLSELDKRKQFSLSEPLLLNSLVANDGSVAGVRITMNMPGIDHEAETPEVVFYIRDLAKKYEAKYPGLKLYLTGQIVVDQAFPESTAADFNFVWPAFFLVMMLLLMFIYRSFSYMLVTMVTGVLSIGAGMGIIGWTHIKVNAAISAAPVMILTLAVADCIHILSSYTHELTLGKSKKDAMIESLRINFIAVLLTSLLTGLGFLTLHFNDSPPYRALGYIVAAGVGFAFLFSVTFLAPLVTLIPHRAPTRDGAGVERVSRAMGKLAAFIIRKDRSVFVAVTLIATGLCVSVGLNQINDDAVKYFGKNQTMRQHLEFVNTRITGIGTLNYSLNSGISQGITSPAYLRHVEEFSDWLKTQPGVLQVDTFVDVIKRINRTLHADDEAFYRIPNSKEEVSQYILLYELSLPAGMDVGNVVTIDKSASRVRVSMTDTSGPGHIGLDEKAKQWLRNNAPSSMWSEGASVPLMFSHISARSIDGMLWGLVGALVIMSGLLVFILRSLTLGLISLASNIVPVAMGFGVWGWVSGDVDLGITVTLGMAFGIVVDDTIHFLSKYQRARRELGYSTEHAITYAFKTVGVALLVTTIVLMAGFSMLGFSDMNITSNMAILTTVTIGCAFFIDFFFLPGLLLRLDKANNSSAKSVNVP